MNGSDKCQPHFSVYFDQQIAPSHSHRNSERDNNKMLGIRRLPAVYIYHGLNADPRPNYSYVLCSGAIKQCESMNSFVYDGCVNIASVNTPDETRRRQ